MTRLILRLLPWWFIAFFALSFLPLTITLIEAELAKRVVLEQALAAAPPQAVDLAQLPSRPSGLLGDELAVKARWRTDLGVFAVNDELIDRAYAVLASDTPPLRFVVLSVPSYQAERLAVFLQARGNAAGLVTVGGFVVDSFRDNPDLRLALDQRGITGRYFVIEPILGDRPSALRDRASDTWLRVALAAGLQAALTITAVVKFHRWRRRRFGIPGGQTVRRPKLVGLYGNRSAGANPPQKPQGPWADTATAKPDKWAKPVVATKTQATRTQVQDNSAAPWRKPRERFSDSPIETRKGWFW